MKGLKFLTTCALCLGAILCPFVCKSDASAKIVNHSNVYEIYTEDDFYELSDWVSSGYGYSNCEVVLMNDLDFKGLSFRPLKYFNGHFDGNDHYIYNLQLDYSNEDYVGFIGSLGKDGLVENLTIYDTFFGPKSYIKGNNYVGGIVGYNAGIVRHCRNAGCKISSKGDYVGGLVGYNDFTGSVTDCRVSSSTETIKNCDTITGYETKTTTTTDKTKIDSSEKFGVSTTTSHTYPVYGKCGNTFIGYNKGYYSCCETYVFFAW